jgi:N-carbamoylputrescine amidase
MKDIRIGAVTCQCEAGNIEKNMNILHEWVCTARQKKVAVLCFPELNITGYSIKKQILSSSFHLSDPRIQKISNIAIDNHMIILAGFLEHSSNQTAFASHLAAFPDGLVRVYRKIHVAPPEKHMIIPGNSIPVFHYQQITFGIQLCYDAHFPEVSTAMALQGADIIFIPHASPHGSPEKKVRSWMRHLSPGHLIMVCLLWPATRAAKMETDLRFHPFAWLSVLPVKYWRKNIPVAMIWWLQI